MEPQFIINKGCLDIFKLSTKDFLEMLNINLKKAISSNEYSNCPKCNRTDEDVYLTYYQYEDFKFGADANGKECDYSFTRINYFLCICGCLYYSGTKASKKSFKEDKTEFKDKDNIK